MTLKSWKSKMVDFPPRNFYDRQVAAFQFKIQQSLNLHDEEIERLSVHLAKTKAKILQAKEQLGNLNREIAETVESKTGMRKRSKASVYEYIARINVGHNHHIQEIQNQQRERIEGLQRHFENEMDRLTGYSSQKLNEKTAALNKKIVRMRNHIKEYEETAVAMQSQDVERDLEVSGDVYSVDHGVIDELQTIIEQRYIERSENLRSSKAKLQKCVDALDVMTQSHSKDVKTRQDHLRDIEENYHVTLNQMQEAQQFKIAMLKGHLDKARMRTNTLLRAAHYLEHKNQKQLKEVVRDLEIMNAKSQLRKDQSLIKESDFAKITELGKKVEKARQIRDEKEDKLHKVRRNNGELKKEVWRLRHEVRFKDAPKMPNP